MFIQYLLNNDTDVQMSNCAAKQQLETTMLIVVLQLVT